MTCRYRFSCIMTIEPFGVHTCPHCGAQVHASKDPEPYCKMGSEFLQTREYIDEQEACVIKQDVVLEQQLRNRK